MKLLTPTMKMADVVHSNYLLMPVISRFGIRPGFGEETVEELCRKNGVDPDFFLAIANAFSNENYFPERKLQAFNVLVIVSYLQKTHSYYMDTQVPLIEALITRLLSGRSPNIRNLQPVKKFFLDYRRELLAHLKREETITFPYIKEMHRVYSAHHPTPGELRALSHYSMKVYSEEHSDIDEKLFDLKNILIKYVGATAAEPVFQQLIFELFRLEKDIIDHTRIENHILMPLVAEMEQALFGRGKKRVTGTITDGTHPLHTGHPISMHASTAPEIQPDHAGLSGRELEVLRLVARGFLNKQIADQLSISLHTVISHRKNITRKLQIKTVAGLTMYAILNGLISAKNPS